MCGTSVITGCSLYVSEQASDGHHDNDFTAESAEAVGLM